jgi:hypothetical protein
LHVRARIVARLIAALFISCGGVLVALVCANAILLLLSLGCAQGTPYGGSVDVYDDFPTIEWPIHEPAFKAAPRPGADEDCGDGVRSGLAAVLLAELPEGTERPDWSVAQVCKIDTCWDGESWRVERFLCSPGSRP